MLPFLHIAAIACFGGGLGVVAWTLAAAPANMPSKFGLRGLRRREALANSDGFRAIEPQLRWHARWIARLPLDGLRAKVAEQLVYAGDWLGLTPDELIAMCMMCATCVGLAGGALVRAFDLPGVLVFFFFGLGATLPYMSMTSRAAARQRQVERSLPQAIDVVALCLGAGLTFTASVRQVVDKSSRESDPLREELEVILHAIRLGTTHEQALSTFAARVPTEAVRQLVSAVQQSERKGTPLAETLQLQAETLRLRRGIKGEEAASRAAVAMLFPLTLIMASILLVLLGPFILQGSLSGF